MCYEVAMSLPSNYAVMNGQFIYTVCSMFLYLVLIFMWNIRQLKKKKEVDYLGLNYENMFAIFFLLAQLNSNFITVIQFSILISVYLVISCFTTIFLKIIEQKIDK